MTTDEDPDGGPRAWHQERVEAQRDHDADIRRPERLTKRDWCHRATALLTRHHHPYFTTSFRVHRLHLATFRPCVDNVNDEIRRVNLVVENFKQVAPGAILFRPELY